MNVHRGVSGPTESATQAGSTTASRSGGRWHRRGREGDPRRGVSPAVASAAAATTASLFPRQPHVIDQLEQRVLLTSLLGGQTLQFIDESGDRVLATLTGPGRAELVGAHYDPSVGNGLTPLLNNIPALITNPGGGGGGTVEFLGGLGGRHGVFPIEAATGNPDSLTQLNGGLVPNGVLNLKAIASNNAGVTYAMNEFTVTPPGGTQQHIVQLNQLNVLGNADATTQANLGPAIVATVGSGDTTDIQSIVDADFQPDNNNLIWFVAIINSPKGTLQPGGGVSNVPVPFLLNVNITNNAVTNVGEFVSDPFFSFAREVVPDIQAFTLDNTGAIVGYGTAHTVINAGTQDQAVVDTHGVFRVARTFAGGQIDITPTQSDAGVGLGGVVKYSPVRLPQGEVTDVIGFELIPGDNDFVYAITPAGAEAQTPHLLHISILNGGAQDFGQLPDPTDLSARQRGRNLSSLTWNPVVKNIFTSTAKKTVLGTLLAPDTNKDELDVVSEQNRFPGGATTGTTTTGGGNNGNSLFAVYVFGSTKDTNFSLSVITVNPDTGEITAHPYDSFGGLINSVNAQTGQRTGATVTSGPGGVFIGSRTPELTATPLTSDIASRRIKKAKSARFGLIPVGTKYIYAGVTIEGDFNNFIVGGTITGRLNVSGSVGEFYGGSLLFGDPGGRVLARYGGGANKDIRGNVYVGGEIRNLLSSDTIGGLIDGQSDGNPGQDTGVFPSPEFPTYYTGFDMEVRGRLGQINTHGSVLGSVRVTNKNQGLQGKLQNEVEDKNLVNSFIGQGSGPGLGGTTEWDNDTFDTAQFVGSSQSPSLGTTNGVEITGSLLGTRGDSIDYYAMSLMAGQQVTVQLTALGGAVAAVFDPDGRLIASEAADINAPDRRGQPFRFTADRPGNYRFAVAADFGQFGSNLTILFFDQFYTLRINNVAGVTAGAIVASSNIYTPDPSVPGIDIGNGDLGALLAGNELYSDAEPYEVDQGNMRSVMAQVMGTTLSGGGLNFLVPKGSVGLLRTFIPGVLGSGTLVDLPPNAPRPTPNPAAGEMHLNESLNPLEPDPDFPADEIPDPGVAVGADVQLVDAFTFVYGNLMADRAIGVLRSGQANFMSNIFVNADQHGSDGVIDLIDVGTQLGDFTNGGPSIRTGPGGNVRYLKNDRFGVMFPPKKFGTGFSIDREFDPGTSAHFLDDSGTAMTITPTPVVPNPNFGVSVFDPTLQFQNPGQIFVDVYPVDDKAGVIVSQIFLDPPQLVSSYGGNDKPNHGLLIESGAAGKHGSVEIGNIYSRNAGRTVTEVNVDPTGVGDVDPNGPPLSISFPDRPAPDVITGFEQVPSLNTPVDFIFRGRSPIDVFNIDGSDKTGPPIPAQQPRAPIDSIVNDTAGEIVSVQARSIGLIQAETIGLAKSHTGGPHAAAGEGSNLVQGFKIVNVDFGRTPQNPAPTPYEQQRNGIMVAGGTLPEISSPQAAPNATSKEYLISARARRGIGNILVVGILSNVEANYDRKNVKGVFEGINAPIVVSATTSASDITDGRLQNLNIGEGLAPSGTGLVPQSGVFVGDTLEHVTNQGQGSDIRGTIIVGSIAALVDSPYLANAIDEQSIGSIVLNDGAIIDTDIITEANFRTFQNWSELTQPDVRTSTNNGDDFRRPTLEVGQITLNGNGGIIGSLIQSQDIGPIAVNGGFGILHSQIRSNTDDIVQDVTTDGYGIRQTDIGGGSAVGVIHARGNGELLNANDYTPSVRNSGKRPFEPYSGIVPNASNDLYRYLGVSEKKPKKSSVSEAGVFEDNNVNGILQLDSATAFKFRERRSRNLISFGNSIGNITALKTIDGLSLTSGSINNVIAGSDIARMKVSMSGPIKRIQSNGTIKGSSVIRAQGPEGRIGSIVTKKSLYATIRVSLNVDSISVGDSLGSKVIAINQDLGKLNITNSIMTGSTVNVADTIKQLIVGGDIQQGAVVTADAINKQKVGGTVSGDIVIPNKTTS